MPTQHFGNTNVQQRTSKEQAHEFMDEEIRIFFTSISTVSKYKKKEKRQTMPELELDCANKSMCIGTRTPVAHGIPKFHKGKGNLPPFRPVVVVV